MTRGPKIKDWVKVHISKEALKARGEPRDSVAERIEEYLEGKEPVPSRDTLLKMISWARNHRDPEDRPWSVLALPAFDIPPEALPVIIKAWAMRVEAVKQSREIKPHNAEHAEAIKAYITPLTIREARWYGRLFHVYKDRLIDRKGEIELSSMVANLAAMEKALELTGAYLWQGPEDKLEDMSWLWRMDSWLHDYLTGKANMGMAIEVARGLATEEKAKTRKGGSK